MSISLSQLKDHLRITWSDEDTILGVYLDAAIDFISEYTGRKISQSSQDSYFDFFSDLELIGDNPLSVVVTYIDTDGNEQTLSDAIYNLKTHKARPYLTLAYGQSWPSVRYEDAAIRVNYTSGYTSETIPDSLVSAVLIEAANNYEFRENETLIKLQNRRTVERLSKPFRVYCL